MDSQHQQHPPLAAHATITKLPMRKELQVDVEFSDEFLIQVFVFDYGKHDNTLHDIARRFHQAAHAAPRSLEREKAGFDAIVKTLHTLQRAD